MRILLSVALTVLAALAFIACNSTEKSASANNTAAAKPAVQADGARRITVPEAQSLLEKGQAVVIDVRNQAAYDQGHVKGAKLIPAAEIGDHVNELPRDKTIITYCS